MPTGNIDKTEKYLRESSLESLSDGMNVKREIYDI